MAVRRSFTPSVWVRIPVPPPDHGKLTPEGAPDLQLSRGRGSLWTKHRWISFGAPNPVLLQTARDCSALVIWGMGAERGER